MYPTALANPITVDNSGLIGSGLRAVVSILAIALLDTLAIVATSCCDRPAVLRAFRNIEATRARAVGPLRVLGTRSFPKTRLARPQ